VPRREIERGRECDDATLRCDPDCPQTFEVQGLVASPRWRRRPNAAATAIATGADAAAAPHNSMGRQAVSQLLALAAVAAGLVAVSAADPDPEALVSFATSCLASSDPAACQTASAQAISFMTSAVMQTPFSVSSQDLTAGCQACPVAASAVAALNTTTGDPAVCPLLPLGPSLAAATDAMRQFACFGASTGVAGGCVLRLAQAFSSLGLLDRVRIFDPTLRFSGDVLQSTCSALWPGVAQGGADAAGVSCCGRSGAMLLSAIAQVRACSHIPRARIAHSPLPQCRTHSSHPATTERLAPSPPPRRPSLPRRCACPAWPLSSRRFQGAAACCWAPLVSRAAATTRTAAATAATRCST
jgi:hypothetical protein